MQRIVVVNAKGGSGKTTIATNLAAYYASHGLSPALMDLDRQGSTVRWLRKRADEQPSIHAIDGHDIPPGVTRSFALRVPAHVKRLVVDTPAALERDALAEAVRDAQRIVIPVLPSDIDIHAATRCVSDLLLGARIRTSENRIAVVANRVKRNTVVFRALMRFLDRLDIPVVAILRDSQNYIRAAESGAGLHETRGAQLRPDLKQWEPLIDWLETGRVPARGALWQDPAETGSPTADPTADRAAAAAADA
jgi:chromosome partitioning protein